MISASAPKTRLTEGKRRGEWAGMLLGRAGELEAGPDYLPLQIAYDGTFSTRLYKLSFSTQKAVLYLLSITLE